jgi:photosystem II stability/assembly factor-like uncharacterized protein
MASCLRWRAAGAGLGLAAAAALLAACPSTPEGTDLFRVAVSGSPGGSFLSVWGDPNGTLHGFLAGGYVGVPHAAIADGRVGRLVEYTAGAFTTRCTTDEVLWWVEGHTDAANTQVVFAAGEGGRVLRYRGTTCERLDTGLTYPEGAPTFWGIHVERPDDVWLVGGSALPTGPRGVLVHYDGTAFRQEADLPMEARVENLYKIDRADDGSLLVVGSGGLMLRRDPGTGRWSTVSTGVRVNDNRLFTVSCSVGQCYAVGGAGSGIVLAQAGGVTDWRTVAGFEDLPGLNGVWVQDPRNVWIVGNNGLTMHTNGVASYRPPAAPTRATLHGVGGNASFVMAAGGELSTTTPDQRGVILVRGDDAPTFTLDGQAYTASGDLRSSLGGAGQGGR